MKKATFQLARPSLTRPGSKAYNDALHEVKKFEGVFKSHPGVITGHWVGLKDGRPYIMVAVEVSRARNPEKLLPDNLGKYRVYYVEGKLRLD